MLLSRVVLVVVRRCLDAAIRVFFFGSCCKGVFDC